MNSEPNNASGINDKPDFEQALGELEALVTRLESGDLSLEQSLDHFKRGVELTRLCQQILDEAQQTIDLLAENEDTPSHSAVESSD